MAQLTASQERELRDAFGLFDTGKIMSLTRLTIRLIIRFTFRSFW